MAEPEPPASPASPASSPAVASAASARGRGRVAALVLAGVALFGLGFYAAPRAARLAGLGVWTGAVAPPAAAPADPLVDQRIAALEARLAERDRAVAAAPAEVPAPGAPDAAARLAALEAAVAQLGEADRGLSARIDAVAAQQAAMADTALDSNVQARDLLLIGIMRRFLDLGRPLGPLLTEVEARFAARDPGAVAALAAWSRAPVSALLLADRLGALRSAPAGAAPAADAGWWQQLWARLSNLVLVRPAAAVDARPAELAFEALRAGDVALGVALLEAAPRNAVLDQWLADARRLSAATAALDRLESRLFDTASSRPPPPVNDSAGSGRPLS